MPNAQQQPDWRVWFQEHAPGLLLFARQQTRNDCDAEDVLQEAFLRVWKRSDIPQPCPPGLVYQAIRRVAIDHARRNSRRSLREERVHEEAPAQWFDKPIEDKERDALLVEAVHQLAPEQQEVLVLKIWAQLTFEEIAHTLDIPSNTAASRYRYALKNLKSSLQHKIA